MRKLLILAVLAALADADQLVHRVEVIDVKLAREVIELVLQRARQETGARDPDRASVSVLCSDRDLLAPRDVRNVARDREATLEVSIVARGAHDTRVDELVQPALDLDHARLQRDSHLGRRESDAGCCTHRLGEVVEQRVKVLAEARYGFALQAKARIAEGHDREDGHGGGV
jgi:hypothetical protein